MSVNRAFGYDLGDPTQESFNLNVAPSRGAGSTYKVFVAAAALARGFSDQYTLTAPSPYRSRVYEQDGGPYTVRNAGTYRATLDLTTALYQSSNTYFVALEDALGSVEEPVRMAEKMGLFQFGPDGLADQAVEDNNGSFTLGPYATSPLGLAGAYSTLAAEGTQCDVVPVTGILDRSGRPLLGEDGEPVVKADNCTPEAIPPGVATTLTQMLRKDVEPGNPGQTAPRAYIPGYQIAGKTGTTQSNLSVAFVGYTPEIAASVMVFNPKDPENVGGFGGGKGATIWHDAMALILNARGSSDFPPADPSVVKGNTRPVPGCSSVADCVRALAAAGFQSTTVTVDSDRRQGGLVGTSPARGARAVPQQVVSILVSNGVDYVEPAPRTSAPVPASAPPSPVQPVGTTAPVETTAPVQPGTPTLPGAVPGPPRPDGPPGGPDRPPGRPASPAG